MSNKYCLLTYLLTYEINKFWALNCTKMRLAAVPAEEAIALPQTL